ncbi:MAG: tetratricopeptide repeat protein [Aliishimia sp.]
MARAGAVTCAMALCACTTTKVGTSPDGVFAPGVDTSFVGRNRIDDGIEVGHRLIAAGEYELALRAFSRAALDRGNTDSEILLGMGTANLGLGRLGQSEKMLRLAIEKEGNWPELWNNLGVVLMERGKIAEAGQIFRKAYALDNGESDSIRDNLRLALLKSENPVNTSEQINDYKLVRRGSSDYLIRRATS